MSIRKALEKVQNFSKAKVDFNEKSYDQLSVDEVHELIKLAENLERYTKNKKQLVELDSKVTKMEEVLQKLDNITFSEIDNLKRLIKNSKSSENLTENLREELTEAIGQVSTRMSTLVGASGSGEVWLKNLDDVDRSSVSSASNGQALVYDSSMGKWKAGAGGGGASDPPEDLSAVSQDIIPDADETRDLGSSTKKWKDLYLSGSTLRLGDVEFKSTTEGDVEIKRAVTSAHGTAGEKVKLKIKELDADIGGGGGGVGGGDMLSVVGNGVRFSESSKAQETISKGGSTPSSYMWESPISGGIATVDMMHFNERYLEMQWGYLAAVGNAAYEHETSYSMTDGMGSHYVAATGTISTDGGGLTYHHGTSIGSPIGPYLVSQGWRNWGGNGTEQTDPNKVGYFRIYGTLWDNPAYEPSSNMPLPLMQPDTYNTGALAWPAGPPNMNLPDFSEPDGMTPVKFWGGADGMAGTTALGPRDENGNVMTKGAWESLGGFASGEQFLAKWNPYSLEFQPKHTMIGLGKNIKILWPDISTATGGWTTRQDDPYDLNHEYRVWDGSTFVELNGILIGANDASDGMYGPKTQYFVAFPDQTEYMKAYNHLMPHNSQHVLMGNNTYGDYYSWSQYCQVQMAANAPWTPGNNDLTMFRAYYQMDSSTSTKINWSSHFAPGGKGKTAIEFGPEHGESAEASGLKMGSQAHHDILENSDFTYEMDFIFAGYASGEGFESSNTASITDTSRYETLPSNIASGSTSLTLFEQGDSSQSDSLKVAHIGNLDTGHLKVFVNGTELISVQKGWYDDPTAIWNSNQSSPGAGDGFYNDLFPNKWYHLALVRKSNTITLFLDGTSIGSAVHGDALTFTNNPVTDLMIGNITTPTLTDGWSGSIDNFRISSMARYNGTFTPSTSKFQVDDDTVVYIDKGSHNSKAFKDTSNETYFKTSVVEGSVYSPIMLNTTDTSLDSGKTLRATPLMGSVGSTITDEFSRWYSQYSSGHRMASGQDPAEIYDFRTGPGTSANTATGIPSTKDIYLIRIESDTSSVSAVGTDHYGVSTTNNMLARIKNDPKFSSFVSRLGTLDAAHSANPLTNMRDFYCAPPAIAYNASIHYPGASSTQSGGTSQAWTAATPYYTGTNGEPSLNAFYGMGGAEIDITEVGGEVILDVILGYGQNGYSAMTTAQALAGFGTTSWSNETVIFRSGTANAGQNDAYNFNLTASATMIPQFFAPVGFDVMKISFNFGSSAQTVDTINGTDPNNYNNYTSLNLKTALEQFCWENGEQPLYVMGTSNWGGYHTNNSSGQDAGFQLYTSGPQTVYSITKNYGPNLSDCPEMTFYRSEIPSAEASSTSYTAKTPIALNVIAFGNREWDGYTGNSNDTLEIYCIGSTSDDVTNMNKIIADTGMSGFGKSNFLFTENGIAISQDEVLIYRDGAWRNGVLTVPSTLSDLDGVSSTIPIKTNTQSSLDRKILMYRTSSGTAGEGEYQALTLNEAQYRLDDLFQFNTSVTSTADGQSTDQFLIWSQTANQWTNSSVDAMVGPSSDFNALRSVDFSSTLSQNIPLNVPGAILTKEFLQYTSLSTDANTVFCLEGNYDESYDDSNQFRQGPGYGGFKDVSTHGGYFPAIPPPPDLQSYTITETGNNQFSYEGNNNNAPDGYIKMMLNNIGNDKTWWDAHFAKWDGIPFPPPAGTQTVKIYTGTNAGPNDDGHNLNGLEFIGDYGFDTTFGNPVFYLHPKSGEDIGSANPGTDGFAAWDWATTATITDSTAIQMDIAGNGIAIPARNIMPVYGSISSSSGTYPLTSPVWVIPEADGIGVRHYGNTATIHSYHVDDSYTSTNNGFYGNQSVLFGGNDSQSSGSLECFAKTVAKNTWTNPDTGSGSTNHEGDFDIPSTYDFCVDGWFKIHSQKNMSQTWYPNHFFTFGTEALESWNYGTHGYGFSVGIIGDPAYLKIYWNMKTNRYTNGSYWPSGTNSSWDKNLQINLSNFEKSKWYHYACIRTQNHFMHFINGNLVGYVSKGAQPQWWYNMLPSQNHTTYNNSSNYSTQLAMESPNAPHYGQKGQGGWSQNHTGFYLGSSARSDAMSGSSNNEGYFHTMYGYLDSWRFRKALGSEVNSSSLQSTWGTQQPETNVQLGIMGGAAPDWLAEAEANGMKRNGWTWTLEQSLNYYYTDFPTDTNVGSPSGSATWFTPPKDKIDNFKTISPVSKPTGSIVAYNPSLNNNINVEYKPFGPPHMTTVERDAAFTTTAQIGAQVYNTDTNKMQGLISDGSGGLSWADLH